MAVAVRGMETRTAARTASTRPDQERSFARVVLRRPPMSAVEVPRVLVLWARKHYRRTARPFLFSPRSGSEWGIVALPGVADYLLMLDMVTFPLAGALATAEGAIED